MLSVSVTGNVVVTGPETEGRYLARYDKDADALFIYPQGLGQGPLLVMDKADWARISDEVRRAFMRADNNERYNAAEGAL